MLLIIKIVLFLTNLLCVLCLGFEIEPRTGHWYKLHKKGSTWTTANKICELQGAYLAIINNEVEARVLTELYQKSRYLVQNVTREATVAIGVYRTISGGWSTVHGQSLEQAGYTKWLVGHPKVDVMAEFGYIDSDGNLLNRDNYERVAFICEKGSNVNTTELVKKLSFPRPYKLDYEFEPRTGHWYKFHARGAKWDDANRTCVAEGAHLAVINSDGEENFLLGLLKKYTIQINFLGRDINKSYLAIGLYWDPSIGVWRTTEGLTFDHEHMKYFHGMNYLPKNLKWTRGYLEKDGRYSILTSDDIVPFICEKYCQANDNNCNSAPNVTELMQELYSPWKSKLGYKFESRAGKWYKLHQEGSTATVPDTNRTCVKEGAHLTVINSDVESRQTLRYILRRLSVEMVAIGINNHDQVLEQADSHPQQDVMPAYGYIDSDGKLDTSGVRYIHAHFLCEKGSDVNATNLVHHTSSPEEKDRGYEFVSRTGRWYKFHTEGAKWPDANRTCVAEGAHLAVMNSDGEEQVLRDLYSKYEGWIHDADNKYYLAIGIYKNTSGVWSTTDGLTINQIGFSWVFNRGGSHWYMEYYGTFNNWGFDDRVPFICEKSLPLPSHCQDNNNYCDSTDVNDTSPWKSRLGYKFEALTGQWYKFHTEGANWPDANRTCVAEGAHLAVANSRAEARVIKDLYLKSDFCIRHVDSKDRAAIGIYKQPSGVWSTVDGQTLEQAGYSKWSSGHPDSDIASVYGYVDYRGTLISYDDFDKVAFICEK